MTSPEYTAIALDTGTTSIKAGLLDHHGLLEHIVARPAPNIVIKNGGRYESDALAYAAAADRVLAEVQVPANGCTIFGLCSQRSSLLIWEKSTGKPITPLISWQDTRGAASCDALRGQEETIRTLTGLPLTPYYFAPKLRSMLLENPVWLEQLIGGELLAGLLDTFLIWRWSGGKHYVTDASMAARTLLMDIRQQKWSRELCDLFGIPMHILPQIMPSAGMNLKLHNGLTLAASVGDQSAALFASVDEDRAEALVNLGTGCFVVRYLATKYLKADEFVLRGYLHALVYQDLHRHPHFAVEGTLNSIAAALAPYPVDECCVEDLAHDDVFCLAEPSGLGAPFFRNDLGIRFSIPVDHLSQKRIAVLLLEAVIFRIARILDDFQRTAGIDRIYLSGGLSGLKCVQIGIASCLTIDVYLLRQRESSLLGAALLAAGMNQAISRECEKLSAGLEVYSLRTKYRRWKEWLDKLLENSTA